MKKKAIDEPRALFNLREFYSKYLSNSSKTSHTLTAELLAAISDSEIENAKFFLLYEHGEKLFCMEETGSDYEIRHGDESVDETVLRQFFINSGSETEDAAYCCSLRSSGVWFDEDNQIRGKVYTALCVGGLEEKQSFFLRCFHEAYSEWIAQTILRIATPVSSGKNFPVEYGVIKEKILKKTVNMVEERMLTLYGIDLGVITEISGSYYEGGTCNAALSFRLGNGDIDGVPFSEEDYVKIDRKNVKRLRKLLEMCRTGHCILAERYMQSGWVVKGLCGLTDEAGSITFCILDHMCWEMKIGERVSLLYKNGKYRVRQTDKKVKELQTVYKKVFKCNPPQYVIDFFKKAEEQPHGTSIIIVDKERTEEGDPVRREVKRLLKKSSGISIDSESEIPEEFVLGVTSIDGAVIMNRGGRVYAIGAILDGTVAIKGDPAHGARHNSVMKYIASKKKGGLKGIGIIFSEDKTIKFISTED